MKKTTTKLQFKKQTIRTLQAGELSQVAGGEPTANCTNEGMGCTSAGPTVDRCAPTHRVHGCTHHC